MSGPGTNSMWARSTGLAAVTRLVSSSCTATCSLGWWVRLGPSVVTMPTTSPSTDRIVPTRRTTSAAPGSVGPSVVVRVPLLRHQRRRIVRSSPSPAAQECWTREIEPLAPDSTSSDRTGGLDRHASVRRPAIELPGGTAARYLMRDGHGVRARRLWSPPWFWPGVRRSVLIVCGAVLLLLRVTRGG